MDHNTFHTEVSFKSNVKFKRGLINEKIRDLISRHKSSRSQTGLLKRELTDETINKLYPPNLPEVYSRLWREAKSKRQRNKSLIE
jgi:hypothetical protein